MEISSKPADKGKKGKKEKKGKDDKKEDLGPMVSVSDVFSKFGRTRKVTLLRICGIFFSMVSGSVYPVMTFFFARSFEDLGAIETGGGMDTVRELAFVFLALGAVGFVFLVGQAVCLEIAASDAQTDFKISWFNALLRQDMAYYDIKDVSSQATIVASNSNKFKRGIGRKLGEGVQFTMTVIGGFVYAFYESWEVSLIVLAVVPLMGGTASFMMAVTTKESERRSVNYQESGKLGEVEEEKEDTIHH